MAEECWATGAVRAPMLFPRQQLFDRNSNERRQTLPSVQIAARTSNYSKPAAR